MNKVETSMPKLRSNHIRLVSHNGNSNQDCILPARPEIQSFCFVVFGYCDGLVPCRSFPEKGNEQQANSTKSSRNTWIKTDDAIASSVYDFAKVANAAGTGCYVIPGTVAKFGQAKSADILQMQTLLIDIDTGNTEEKLQILKESIGEPTLIVESGGITDCQNKKLHVYWQLTKAVQGQELQQLLQLRYKIALAVGGDLHFKSAHQPIRVAGSIYHKGATSKQVTIRSYNPVEYELDELISSTEALGKNYSNNSLVSHNAIASALPIMQVPQTLSLHQILTTKVYAGGKGEQTRFCLLSKVIGYWIRRCHDGLVSKEQAINEITDYNIANVVPSWPYAKLEKMINGIWQSHFSKYGDPKVIPQQHTDNDNIINSITPANWQDLPPERKWLIENWLPRGFVTALYGDGGVGKSLLTQQLMTALAIGKPFLGKEVEPARVYAVMCEDDYSEIWRRQAAINSHYMVNMRDLTNIRIVSRVGKNNLLVDFANNNTARQTEFYTNLLSDITNHKPDLVVLDTAADMFGGNENNRLQVRQFIQSVCGHIARSTGSAVLLCAHPSENGMQRGSGSCGSTAWNNTVRSRWYLKYEEGKAKDQKYENNKRILSRVKSNYSAIGEDVSLTWQDGIFIWLGTKQIKTTKTANGKINHPKSQNNKQLLRIERINAIVKLLEQQALNGKFYSMKQFAEKYQNYQQLGGRRAIYDDCSIAATDGVIKFFNNPRYYGIQTDTNNISIGFGYMCSRNMQIENADGQRIAIVPTHFKDKTTAKKQLIRKNHSWPITTELLAEEQHG
ncbi:MAG: hypothetical protein Tsb006_5110 [Rickettsiaceae bacterium]